MKKMLKRVILCLCISAVCWSFFLLRDKATLHQELIRLHVVANSDSQEDQAVKLKVRDAILESVKADLENIHSKEAAIRYLNASIPKLQSIANKVLEKAGFDCGAVVTFCKEAFPIRHYETFSLPSGVYDALRITIGEGAGQNWWCVAFPALCISATADGVQEQAVSAGFSESLSDTLTDKETYQVRFYLLDSLGKLENYIFKFNLSN